MNETVVQAAIMSARQDSAFVLPNWTPIHWWECDVFAVTKAGYFNEFEIKLTISDFKHDRKKCRPKRFDPHSREWIAGTRKHDLLERGDEHGPNRFYFVAPEGMIAIAHREHLDPLAVLPDWAGLIEITEREGCWCPDIKIVKRAPQLHSAKYPERRLAEAKKVCYGRYHAMWRLWAEKNGSQVE